MLHSAVLSRCLVQEKLAVEKCAWCVFTNEYMWPEECNNIIPILFVFSFAHWPDRHPAHVITIIRRHGTVDDNNRVESGEKKSCNVIPAIFFFLFVGVGCCSQLHQGSSTQFNHFGRLFNILMSARGRVGKLAMFSYYATWHHSYMASFYFFSLRGNIRLKLRFFLS